MRPQAAAYDQAMEAYRDLRGRIMNSNPDLQNDSAGTASCRTIRSCCGRLSAILQVRRKTL